MSDTQDVLKIDMVEYKPSGLKNAKGNWGGASRSKAGEGDREIIGTVVLPIPGGIKDADKVGWSDNNMSALDMALADLGVSTIKDGISGAQHSLESTVAAMSNTGGADLKKMVTSAFAASAIGKDFKSIMARSTGQILNPNMELLFTGPALRPLDRKSVV